MVRANAQRGEERDALRRTARQTRGCPQATGASATTGKGQRAKREDGAEPQDEMEGPTADAAAARAQHYEKEAAQPVPASPGLPPGAHPQGRLAPRRPEAERGRAARDVFPDSAGRQRGYREAERRDCGVSRPVRGPKRPRTTTKACGACPLQRSRMRKPRRPCE